MRRNFNFLHVQGVVKHIEEGCITLTDNTVIPFGLCIWSTGVGPTPFTLSLPFAKTKVGRIAVDGYMRVLAPPLQEQGAAGHVRAEGDAVGVTGQVRVDSRLCIPGVIN
jgi:NADH:ubiquinone reductase (non-electrogenic)